MQKDSALSLQLSKYSSKERVDVSVKDGFEPVTVSRTEMAKMGADDNMKSQLFLPNLDSKSAKYSQFL